MGLEWKGKEGQGVVVAVSVPRPMTQAWPTMLGKLPGSLFSAGRHGAVPAAT